jgi:hypothetical protein
VRVIVTASVTSLCYARGEKVRRSERGNVMVSVSQASASWIPWGQRKPAETRRGMLLAFKPTASRALADVPAEVVAIGPRFRSGDYLVTLEYARPRRYRNEVIQRIDAFRSELYPVEDQP